jgi:hypothetical protein
VVTRFHASTIGVEPIAEFAEKRRETVARRFEYAVDNVPNTAA